MLLNFVGVIFFTPRAVQSAMYAISVSPLLFFSPDVFATFQVDYVQLRYVEYENVLTSQLLVAQSQKQFEILTVSIEQ